MTFANDVNDVEQCPFYPMVTTEAQVVCGPPITRRETRVMYPVNIQYVVWIFTTEFPGEFCLHCVNPFSNELHMPIILVRILTSFAALQSLIAHWHFSLTIYIYRKACTITLNNTRPHHLCKPVQQVLLEDTP